MKLDAVIELVVDENALAAARREPRARDAGGRRGRARRRQRREPQDGTRAYRKQTAPVSAFYAEQGELKQVDGMAPIDEVTRQIMERLGG